MKRVIILSTFYFLLFTPVFAQSVDLLWQGETYTPPFYHGKALWSKQSQVNLLAIPHGFSSPAGLFYKWSKNGTVLGNVNGVGRNTLSFLDTPFSKPQTVKIEILSSDEEVLASASLTLNPVSPALAVYENHPLYGFLFNKEVGGAYQMTRREITFAAFPLFFSILDRNDNSINYQWRTNTGGAETGNSVTYRAPEDASGSSLVSVKASHANLFMQSGNSSFLVQFGRDE